MLNYGWKMSVLLAQTKKKKKKSKMELASFKMKRTLANAKTVKESAFTKPCEPN